jgi:hypothetical protein
MHKDSLKLIKVENSQANPNMILLNKTHVANLMLRPLEEYWSGRDNFVYNFDQ